MNISFAFKNFEASDHLKKYARRRMEKLGRFYGKSAGLEVNVVLTVDKFRHRCEVTVSGEGLHINATEQTSDMYAAIDLVVDKVEAARPATPRWMSLPITWKLSPKKSRPWWGQTVSHPSRCIWMKR